MSADSLARGVPGYPDAFRTKPLQSSADHLTGAMSRVPSELILKSGRRCTIVKVVPNEASPLRLSPVESGEVRLFGLPEDAEVAVSLASARKVFEEKVEGFPIRDFCAPVGEDRIMVSPFRGCQHWEEGEQCLFCNLFGPDRERNRIIPSIHEARSEHFSNARSWWKARGPRYLDALEQALTAVFCMGDLHPHTHLCIMVGNTTDPELQWEIALETARTVDRCKRLSLVDSYLNIMPPQSETFLQEARSVGFRSLQFNLEVFGPDQFAHFCPGKSRIMPYQKFLEVLERAADVFGCGNARSNVVFGLQDEEAAFAGAESLAELGVATDYTVFVPKAGTPLSSLPSPAPDAIAGFTSRLVSLYHANGFRPIYCSLSSRSSIVNDVFGDLQPKGEA